MYKKARFRHFRNAVHACVGYQITDCYYGDLFSLAMNMFPEHLFSFTPFLIQCRTQLPSIRRNFVSCIATDILGETGPLLGVMGYWVDNCFVLHEKLMMSLQRRKAAHKSFNLMRILIVYMLIKQVDDIHALALIDRHIERTFM
jgi:hypothetical protein